MTNFKRNPATMPYGAIIRPHVDPPAGLGCIDATNTHPRWDKSGSNYIYGRDWFGFKGLPGGYHFTYGSYFAIGLTGVWWSSTSMSSNLAQGCYMRHNMGGFYQDIYYYYKTDSFSVRCVRDEAVGEASDSDGTVYTDDYTDGSSNKYDGVKIGEQVWITKNLITTKYQNGNNITGAYKIYPHADVDGIASEQAMIDAYGILYNWNAVDNDLVTGDYRVPSNADWKDLTDYLISQYDVTKDNVAMILKSCRQVDHTLA